MRLPGLSFRVRTLLIAITVLSVPLAWVIAWRHDRNAFLATAKCEPVMGWRHNVISGDVTYSPPAPFPLRPFGELGVKAIYFEEGTDPRIMQRAGALFPEASIETFSREDRP